MNRRKAVIWAAAVLAVWGTGVYFRSFSLQPWTERPPAAMRQAVEEHVRRNLAESAYQNLKGAYPQVPEPVLRTRASEAAAGLISSDPAQFQKTVADILARSPAAKRNLNPHRYLLESDSYYYYRLTRRLAEEGTLGTVRKERRFYDPMRLSPRGFWQPVTLHPYLGLFFHRIVNLFGPLPLMQSCAWFPLAFLLAVAGAYFFLCRQAGLGVFPAFVSGMVFLLAPIFLQRSSFGWYDTDSYNLFFPALITAVFLAAAHASEGRASAGFSALAALLTGLYALFWVGWPFIFILMSGASVFLSLAGPSGIRDRVKKFALIYMAAVPVFAMTFTSPSIFWDSIRQGAAIIGKFAASQPDVWPNIFLTVGEAKPTPPGRLIHLTGNFFSFAAAAAGMLLGGIHARNREKPRQFTAWALFMLITGPLVLMALRTERFALLVVLPAAFFTAMAVEAAWEGMNRLQPAGVPGFWKSAGKSTAAILICLFLFPASFIYAYALARNSRPIMNEAWEQAMLSIRDKTPEDAVIYSWWPPGYFIASLGKRAVISDGGTQHLPETYWLARLFMSTSEKEAAGILKMLQSGGGRAVEYLQEKMPLPEAVDLVNRLLPMGREQALEAAGKSLAAPEAEALLDLLKKPGEQRPAYLMIYNEMPEQNLALSLMARWNFHRAAAESSPFSLSGALKEVRPGRAAYINEVIRIADGIPKYHPPAGVSKKEGDILFFGNGLRVDLKTMEAEISVPGKELTGAPEIFFFMEGGELREKPGLHSPLNISALLFKDGDDHLTLLADKELIRSLLYRLYYLQGGGWKCFRPFTRAFIPEPETDIRIFETEGQCLAEAS